MKAYIDIVKNVLKNGQMKGNRTGIRTLTTFCEIFRHNMRDGFPLLTTKKMPLKTIAVELEGFIQGITDKRWFQERGCKIWNEWANPKAVIEQAAQAGYYRDGPIAGWSASINPIEYQKEVSDLGPIYGYQWRCFGQEYPNKDEFTYGTSLKEFPNGVFEGKDQLKVIVETLKNNPDDRRMVVSAWNPNQMSMMALPPCHYAFTLVHLNGVLNLCWKQRSCDLMLGVPFNIASYAMLLLLLCEESGLIPGELVGILEDCHIYENQIDGAKEQITREPKSLPTLVISNNEDFNIFTWTHKDLELLSYNPHSKIDFGEVAV